MSISLSKLPNLKLFTGLLLAIAPTFTFSQLTFTDISPTSGINYFAKSYGASWGDINGDGFSDPYFSWHYNYSEDIFGGFSN